MTSAPVSTVRVAILMETRPAEGVTESVADAVTLAVALALCIVLALALELAVSDVDADLVAVSEEERLPLCDTESEALSLDDGSKETDALTLSLDESLALCVTEIVVESDAALLEESVALSLCVEEGVTLSLCVSVLVALSLSDRELEPDAVIDAVGESDVLTLSVLDWLDDSEPLELREGVRDGEKDADWVVEPLRDGVGEVVDDTDGVGTRFS